MVAKHMAECMAEADGTEAPIILGQQCFEQFNETPKQLSVVSTPKSGIKDS